MVTRIYLKLNNSTKDTLQINLPRLLIFDIEICISYVNRMLNKLK